LLLIFYQYDDSYRFKLIDILILRILMTTGNDVVPQELGVVPVIPTPFDSAGEIDEFALRRFIDFAVGCGVQAVCLPAYASEFYKLSDSERTEVVRIAVEEAAGRISVIAQCNHGSARFARSLAQASAALGADVISVAVPRLFALSDDDLMEYLAMVLNGVPTPCLVQDFNPGGPTIGPEFTAKLFAACPNLRYLKLEEALCAQKVTAIRDATQDQVGILEGWGGLYMMELIPVGICGVMPGLGMADVLTQVYALRKRGEAEAAFALHEKVLSHIVFSLQNMELYIYMEKRLLEARGVLGAVNQRVPHFRPDKFTDQYVGELTNRILRVAYSLNATMPRSAR